MGAKKKTTKEKKHKFSLSDVFSYLKSFILASESIIGLDIGSSYIKIAQLRKTRGKYTISNHRVRALPVSTKENPQEKKRLIQGFVNEFMSDTHIRTKIGRLALWGGGVYIFSLNVPSTAEKELKNVVRIELKKKLPFQVDLSNILSNFFVVDKIKDDKGMIFQITCIAMDKYILEENIRIFKEIGIKLTAINVVPDALGNLINEIYKGDQCSAVLDMGAKETIFNFYKKGLLQFSRQIPIGGNQITQAIMKAMVTIGMTNAKEEDAEKVKRQCGVPLEEDVFLEYLTDLGVIKGSQISVALRPILERYNTEMTRTINYYYRTFRVDKIDGLYLTGGASRLKNIDKFLDSNLQNQKVLNIERLNPLKIAKQWTDSGISSRGLVMEEAAPHLSAAFGLCINKGGKVNLLPPKEILEQRIGFLATITRITFFLFLGVILSLYSFSYSKCLVYKKSINITQTDIIRFSPKVKSIEDYMTMKGILTERKYLLENLIGKQPLWRGVLKELSNVTPKGIILTGLEIRRKGLGRELYLVGEVYAEYTTIDLSISQYFVTLEESPYFTNIRPLSTERDVYSPIPKANFQITCDLVY